MPTEFYFFIKQTNVEGTDMNRESINQDSFAFALKLSSTIALTIADSSMKCVFIAFASSMFPN